MVELYVASNKVGAFKSEVRRLGRLPRLAVLDLSGNPVVKEREVGGTSDGSLRKKGGVRHRSVLSGWGRFELKPPMAFSISVLKFQSAAACMAVGHREASARLLQP